VFIFAVLYALTKQRDVTRAVLEEAKGVRQLVLLERQLRGVQESNMRILEELQREGSKDLLGKMLSGQKNSPGSRVRAIASACGSPRLAFQSLCRI
jgi:hypothetical protein